MELLAATGACLVFAGIVALVIASTTGLLPQDLFFLQMTRAQLCALQECRILHFMVHDRVSFGGAIIATGLTYVWLAARPLARGEAWAWWALAISGVAGFLSFLAYLGFGYLDLWHGRATFALLPLFVTGLVRAAAISPTSKREESPHCCSPECARRDGAARGSAAPPFSLPRSE